MLKPNRRSFIAATGATMAWPLADIRVGCAADRTVRTKDYPFTLGVASGDPTSDGVVLWTRLAPDPLNGGGMPNEDVQVQWVIADDEAMTRVVQKGVATASADWGHSVHVEANGLQSDHGYFYQFKVGQETSPVGRTRTTPDPSATPDQLNFAFASCQHYESGYYTALRAMAEDDLHCIIHLGDYIYEGGIAKDKVRQHNSAEIISLDDYRNRHALYRADADLQAAHQSCAWLVTWDDHEFDNNYAGDISEETGVDLQAFLARRAAAYKAYYEHMPLRKTSLPRGAAMPIYRNIRYGTLAQFSVLDTRQYRTDQPCGDKNTAPCDGVFDPNATLLGERQEAWLCDSLQSSKATWNILAQQIMMARVDRNPLEPIAYSMDQWAGYEVARKRLLKFMDDHQVKNPVVLTGDIHTNWVNDLKVDFDDAKGRAVATEFVGTSISSGGDGSETRKDTAGVLRDNPFVKFYNAERGYVRCHVTPSRWQADYRVTPVVTQAGGETLTRASFVVESDRPGAERA